VKVAAGLATPHLVSPAPTRCAAMVRGETTSEQVEPRGDHWRLTPSNRVPPLASRQRQQK